MLDWRTETFTSKIIPLSVQARFLILYQKIIKKKSLLHLYIIVEIQKIRDPSLSIYFSLL